MFGLYFTVFCAVFHLALSQCGQEGYTYPDDTNCRNYYICRNNSPVKLQCPKLLYWNCYNSTCARGRVQACCPQDDSFKIGGLTVPCVNGMKMPDLSTCNRYYLCQNHTYQPYYCAAGQKFDPILMKCRTARLGNCATKKTTTTPTTTTGTTGTTGTGTTGTGVTVANGFKIPNVFNCSKYYTFQNMAATTNSCPSGQYYNCWQRGCATKKSPLCCTSMPLLPGANVYCPTNGVTNSAPMSCVSYYKCVNNKVTRQYCPTGQAFDAWTSQCMSPIKARCGIKPGLTVCEAGLNGKIPTGYVNFNISIACPKW